ncbi:MAG TPA: dienelactone hydrolase family protein, partial [Planctomycetota bacterium]|nr:dienelactone hydrolase family protein [Planctomycetota bacterium]
LKTPGGPAPRDGFPVLLALHGFGDDGPRLDARLTIPDEAPYARLFPDAPFPVEGKDDAGRPRLGRSWYAYDGDQERFLSALRFAEGYLRDALDAAARRAPVDPRRVVLFGYSQGGYLAAVAAFRDRTRYRALAGAACRVKTEALGRELIGAAGYPVLLLHGRADAHTPLDRQEAAVAELRRAGVDVALKVHDGGHGLRRDAGVEVDAFVRRAFGAAAPESAR